MTKKQRIYAIVVAAIIGVALGMLFASMIFGTNSIVK